MAKSTIYITGLPGFKSTILANLGPDWTGKAEDLGPDLVGLELPKNVTPERLKQMIIDGALPEHNNMLFYKLYDNILPTYTILGPIRRLIDQVVKIKYW
jgi:hypothetical protein